MNPDEIIIDDFSGLAIAPEEYIIPLDYNPFDGDPVIWDNTPVDPDDDALTPEEEAALSTETQPEWYNASQKKRLQYSFDDADDDWYSGSKPSSTPSYYGGGNKTSNVYSSWGWSKWWDWWSSWGKSAYNFDSIEEKMARTEDIEKDFTRVIDKHDLIAKSYVNGETNVTRKQWGIFSLSIENKPEWRTEMNILEHGIDIWKKFPSSQNVEEHSNLISTMINHHVKGTLPTMFNGTQLFFDSNYDEIQRLSGEISRVLSQPYIHDPDVEYLTNLIPPKILKDIETSRGHGGISSQVDVYSHVSMMNKPLRITPPQDKYVKRPHISKGKRINKWFIQQTDYRALRTKEKVLNQKKKLLILLDGSGSMHGDPFKIGSNFIAEIVKLNIFDVDIYHTNDQRVIKANKAMDQWISWESKWQFLDDSGGSEWFEYLTTRLGNIPRDEDYVLIVTDMQVPRDAEANLKSFIGSKKHLILSFESPWTFKCNVRLVKKYEDMMNVIGTLLN